VLPNLLYFLLDYQLAVPRINLYLVYLASLLVFSVSPLSLPGRMYFCVSVRYAGHGAVLSGMSKVFLTEGQSSPSRMKLLTRRVFTYVTEAYFMIIGCLICGCIFEMWGNFHYAATRVSYCIRLSPHVRTMSADCPGTDSIQCFVSTPTWPVQSTRPCHVVELQLEYVRVVHF